MILQCNLYSMQCKKCSESKVVKAGFVRGKQRYKCNNCRFFFTETDLRSYPIETKVSAIRLYLEGLGFRAIERLIGVSNVAVMYWVRNLAEEINNFKQGMTNRQGIITVMEMDEMWHYVGKKKKNSGYGWLLTEIPVKSLPSNSVVVVRKQEESYGKK